MRDLEYFPATGAHPIRVFTPFFARFTDHPVLDLGFAEKAHLSWTRQWSDCELFLPHPDQSIDIDKLRRAGMQTVKSYRL